MSRECSEKLRKKEKGKPKPAEKRTEDADGINAGCVLDYRELEGLLEAVGPEGVLPLVCTGGSMVPFFLHRRTILYLRAGRPERIRKGDVLLYKRSDGHPVLHRVMRIERTGVGRGAEACYIMNGDAQSWTERIDASQILGYPESFRRKGSGSRLVHSSSGRYRLAVSLWQLTCPFRPVIFRMYGCLKKQSG